jgi:hypothetical protein
MTGLILVLVWLELTEHLFVLPFMFLWSFSLQWQLSVLCLENRALAPTLSMLNADIKFSSTGCFPILGILGPQVGIYLPYEMLI